LSEGQGEDGSDVQDAQDDGDEQDLVVVGDSELQLGQTFSDITSLKQVVNAYAKKRNFLVNWCVEENGDRGPRARASCSRAGKPRKHAGEAGEADPSMPSSSRKKTSKKCGCRWLVTCQRPRDAPTEPWTITALELQHTPPCNPSEAQFVVMHQKRGTHVNQAVFDQLCNVIKTMNPTTRQIRSWMNEYCVGLRTDAQSICNLKARVNLYAVRE